MRLFTNPFWLKKHSTREKRLLWKASKKPAEAPKPNKEAAKEKQERDKAYNDLVGRLREKKDQPSGKEIKALLGEALKDGKLAVQEVESISNSIFRKLAPEVEGDVEMRLGEAIPRDGQGMITLLVDHSNVMSGMDYGRLTASAAQVQQNRVQASVSSGSHGQEAASQGAEYASMTDDQLVGDYIATKEAYNSLLSRRRSVSSRYRSMRGRSKTAARSGYLSQMRSLSTSGLSGHIHKLNGIFQQRHGMKISEYALMHGGHRESSGAHGAPSLSPNAEQALTEYGSKMQSGFDRDQRRAEQMDRDYYQQNASRSRSSFARHTRGYQSGRDSGLRTIATYDRLGRGPLADDHFRRQRLRQQYGIPEGGFPSESELRFRQHVENAKRSGAYVEFHGNNSVFIDRTSKAGQRAYWMDRISGGNRARYVFNRKPIEGYDVNDPHRDAYTGYRKGNDAYSKGMNSYYDKMGGPQYLRDQAKLRGRYTDKMMGEFPQMIEEFVSFGPRFRDHPRFGSSYRKWDGLLKQYGGRFPDQYAYLTEFRTQIQAYRKASEVQSHIDKNRETMNKNPAKGEKYIPIPASPAARWRSLTVSVSKRNPDGSVSKFVYHPGVVEQFDASRDLEGMIDMGVDIERDYSLIGDRDGKKKLKGVKLRFANEGLYTVDVVSDGYRENYDVPVGAQAAKDRVSEKKEMNKSLGAAHVELPSECGVMNIQELGDKKAKQFTVGNMKVGEEFYGEYGIVIRKMRPSGFKKQKYEIQFSQAGMYKIQSFYQRGGHLAFDHTYHVKSGETTSTHEKSTSEPDQIKNDVAEKPEKEKNL